MKFWKRLGYLLPWRRRAAERDMQDELRSITEMAAPGERGAHIDRSDPQSVVHPEPELVAAIDDEHSRRVSLFGGGLCYQSGRQFVIKFGDQHISTAIRKNNMLRQTTVWNTMELYCLISHHFVGIVLIDYCINI